MPGDAGVLLAIDVGNTNIKLGTFRGDALSANWRLRTDAQGTADGYAAQLHFLLERARLRFEDVGGVSLSSTVPALVPILRELVAHYVGPRCPFVEVSARARTGITIAIDNPLEMGADRIVDALAAARLYRLPAIVVDFGTATTFGPIDADERLLGAVLAPGLMTAMDGLFQRAAKLARIELRKPTEVIGRDTVSALRSGWVYGYVGLVEGLIARIKREIGQDCLVIATGGLAELVLSATDVADVHDPLLTLKGLKLFYDLNTDLNSADAA